MWLGARAPAVSAGAAYLDTLLAEAHVRHLADQRPWRLLLHDHRSLLGFYESEIDGPDFFLARAGRTHPSAELDATLAAFFEPAWTDGSDRSPAQCRFPARYQWLKEELHFD